MKYLLFVGQKATTGTANQNTGNFSNYGNVLRFDSKKTRDFYLDTHVFSVNENVVSINARKHCLGMSIETYDEYIEYLDIITAADLKAS